MSRSVVSTRACFIPADAGPTEHWARSAHTAAAHNKNENENENDAEVVGDEDTSVLIPWLDLLNHSSDIATASATWKPPTAVQPSSDGRTVDAQSAEHGGGCYEVVASVDMSVGDTVFLSYGGHSNELLLARYGFVDRSHPADVAAIPTVTAVERLLDAIRAIPTQDQDSCCAAAAAAAAVKGSGKQQQRQHRGQGKCPRHAATEPNRQSQQSQQSQQIQLQCLGNDCGDDDDSCCKCCAARVAVLSSLCLWPISQAGELGFFDPPTLEADEEDEEDEGAAALGGGIHQAVSWNLLTIVRVLTATDIEVLGPRTDRGGAAAAVQRAVSDECISEASELRAKAVLLKLADALLTETQNEPPQQHENDPDGSVRLGVLRSLREHRRAVLRSAIATGAPPG